MNEPLKTRHRRNTGWITLLWFAAGMVSGMADIAPVRGRDPWVFRMTLENKTRMVVLALRSDLWASYNPANGTLHKVWSGGIDFRGKVYDFGQRNSVTTGNTYHLLRRAFILSATDESSLPAGWSATGISTGNAWSFATGSSSMLVSPRVDLTRHDRVILAYQTPGANDRLLVDVSTDNGNTWNAQNWMSVDHAVADGNQKLLEVSSPTVKVRFRRNSTSLSATLADITLFGDYRAWSVETGGSVEYPEVDWRGYRLVNQTEAATLLYDLVLADGRRISVEESPEALPGAGLQRRFVLGGLPAASRVSLELDGVGYEASRSLTGAAALRSAGGATFLDFTASGEATLETLWTPAP